MDVLPIILRGRDVCLRGGIRIAGVVGAGGRGGEKHDCGKEREYGGVEVCTHDIYLLVDGARSAVEIGLMLFVRA